MIDTKGMSPSQLIKLAIIKAAESWEQLELDGHVNKDNIDDIYRHNHDECNLDDCDQEVRCGGVLTGLPSESSRHYECDSVAIRIEGVWVGFPYWHGGGKHGEPESIGWIDSAYFVKATPKVITAYDFEKLDNPS